MNHVAVYYYFVQALVQSGLLPVAHVAFANQLVDALTQQLSYLRLREL